MLARPITKRAAIHARVIVVSRCKAEVSGQGNPFHVCHFHFRFRREAAKNSPFASERLCGGAQFPSRNLYPRGISISLAPRPSATPALRLMESKEFNAVANCVGREILDPRDFDGVGGEMPHPRRDVRRFFKVEARRA